MDINMERLVEAAGIFGPWTGGLLVGLVVLLVLMRARKRHGLFLVGRAITMPLVLAWEAQGLHELARATGLDGPAAWAVALLTSAILATLAAGADEHHKRHGNLGWPGRLVWIVAVPMGLIVALTSATPAVFALRIVLPLLVALLWWVKYAPVVNTEPASAAASRAGAWRWTPRRIGVALGLLDPTDADLSQVHAERQIRRLTTTAHKLHHGTRLLRGRRAAKLRRLGLVATPAMVAEVQRRVSLVHEIERLTDPLIPRPGADIAGGHVRMSGADITPQRPVSGTAKPTARPADLPAAGPRRKSSRTRGGQAGTVAERIAALVEQHPDMTRTELARQVGTSTRHVRRVLADMATRTAEPAPDLSGHAAADTAAPTDADVSGQNPAGRADIDAGRVPDIEADMPAGLNGHRPA